MVNFPVVLDQAETHAANGDVTQMVTCLRKLPFADFCSLHLDVSSDYPSLKSRIPRLPSAADQTRWVGDHGLSLMKRSANLVRLYEYLSWRHSGRSLRDHYVLDYGCGWGRLLRLMPYFVDHDRLEGVDALKASVDICLSNGVLSLVRQVNSIPDRFDSDLFGRFGIVSLFSVFTHTPDWLTREILRLAHTSSNSDALVFCTIRTDDWLVVRNGLWPQDVIDGARASFGQTGYAFIPIGGISSGFSSDQYGDTIVSPNYFSNLCEMEGWRVLAFDRDMSEPFQLCVILEKL